MSIQSLEAYDLLEAAVRQYLGMCRKDADALFWLMAWRVQADAPCPYPGNTKVIYRSPSGLTMGICEVDSLQPDCQWRPLDFEFYR